MFLKATALHGGAASPLQTTTNVPDGSEDESIICNHAPLKNAPVADVRCGNAVTAGGMLLFGRGARPSIELPVRNDLPQPIETEWVVALADRHGTVLRRETRALAVPARGAGWVRYTLETAGLPYGVYDLTLTVNTAGRRLAGRQYYLGVISDTTIPKAADGAFLYGLDPNYGGVVPKAPVPAAAGRRAQSGQADLLGWIDAMGVDIVRSAGCGIDFGATLHPERLAWITNDWPILRQHGLRVTGMAGPLSPNPKAPDAFLPEDVQKLTDLLEKTVARVPDIVYWELGNEPDLGYPGMDRYVQIFEPMYRAIKRGNPKAIVMNGGLSWAHGDVGLKNSRRFIERVKPECIDVIAFHAHGPGAEHEKRVYELTHQAAVQFGKADKPLVDTESGMFVASKLQEDMQAWMVVKKQVYAQSVGLQCLMTFRLHAFRSERGWGLLRSDQEPQPAILAYRTMTEHLKGLAFQKKLELSQAFAQGYTFAQSNGPRRACVVWADQPACYNVYLKLAPSAAQAGNLRQMDLYGNASPADVSEDGVAHVEVTQWPVYLLWDAADPQAQVAVTRSILRTPDMATLVPDGTSLLDLTVENPSGEALTASLSAAITAPGWAAITPEKQTITVPAYTSAPVRMSVEWNAQRQDARWPATWTVYSDVAEGDVALAALRQVPATIRNVAGRQVQSVGHAISLLRPSEPPTNRRLGFVFGTVRSDRDQVVRIGCTADWWMELRLNGQIVCDTMKTGNGSVTLTERMVDLPLKKGDNLLAAKVLSGQSGWHLDLALPDELPALVDPRKGNNCIDLALASAGRVMARERLAIRPVKRVAPLGDRTWDDPLEKWQAVPGDFVLGSAHVSNLFEKLPDNTKWWQGEKDLSATAWMRCDAKRFYLTVWVLDDKDVTGKEPETIRLFDGLRVATSADGKAMDAYSIGCIDGRTAIYKEQSAHGLGKGSVAAGATEVQAVVTRLEKGTFYRVSLDRTLVGDGVFRFNFMVNDNDWGDPKQYLELASGMAAGNPALWLEFIPSKP